MVLTVHLNRVIIAVNLGLKLSCDMAETGTFIYLISLLNLFQHLERLADTIIHSHLQMVQQQSRLEVLYHHYNKQPVMSAKATTVV